MKKNINLILRKCKTLSRHLTRTSSYSSLRSKSSREAKLWGASSSAYSASDDDYETVFVGSSRKRYLISSKYLNHPLLNALIERSSSKHHQQNNNNNNSRLPADDDHGNGFLSVKCEVVFFDHLLWMLDNAEPNLTSDSMEELAELYVL